MSDIEIEIDGKKLQVKPDTMVIQVADEAGIYIPRFCYHKHLSVAANCRMCLVEVEKSPKALPACATPVMPGMKVFTRSPKAIAAQKAVMEFLLINHPLDCPICDQGGECELQDLSMGYGSPDSYYCEGKRSVKDQDIGPLIATDMTRCIQCTRCVRYGSEVAGFPELGAMGRGEDMEIGTYVQHAMKSEVSGNIIDLCPVGALTSKPYRFTARAWELQQYPSIAAHDCAGSSIYVHTRRGIVMRVVPHENAAINQTWLSDRDRFSYEGLYHADRLEKPRIRRSGQWEEVDWQTALEFAVHGIQNLVKKEGADQLGALASPNSTVEEFYLLQKLIRQLGSPHIDYRLRQVDFRDEGSFSEAGMPFAELENCDVILLIGSQIQREQPVLSLRVRKASQKGAKILAINMMDYDFHFKVTEKKIVAPHRFVAALREVSLGLEKNEAHPMAELLRAGKRIGILIGAQALNHPEAARIKALAHAVAGSTGAAITVLTEGANAAGGWLAGATPEHHVGKNARTLWEQPCKGYVLLNVEPDLDCANPYAAVNALEQAEFVVSLSVFKNPLLDQFAHVMLPIAPFTETSGTFVNAEGKWQSFKGVAQATGESRPGWKVLRVLGTFLGFSDFEYKTSEEVREVARVSAFCEPGPVTDKPQNAENEAPLISRIGDIPIYAGDNLVRRSKSLQATQILIEGNLNAARMNAKTAQGLNVKETEIVLVKQQESRLRLPVVLDERVPDEAVFIAGGIPATSGLSALYSPIEIQKVSYE